MKTPETEAEPSRWQHGNSAEFIHADFARKLERERNLLAEKLGRRPYRESWIKMLGDDVTAQAGNTFLMIALRDMVNLVKDVIENGDDEELARIERAEKLLESINLNP